MHQIEVIPLSAIDPPSNPLRTDTTPAGLDDLARSIKHHGILEPLLLNKRGDRYVVVAGARRYLAALQIGEPSVLAIVLTVSDDEAMVISLHENLYRKDLNPIEEASALYSLEAKYHFTREKIATLLGLSRAYVSQRLDILNWPVSLQDLVEQGEISYSVARELAKLPDLEVMQSFIDQAVTGGATARVAAKWVGDWLAEHAAAYEKVTRTDKIVMAAPHIKDLTPVCFACGSEITAGPITVDLCPECASALRPPSQT